MFSLTGSLLFVLSRLWPGLVLAAIAVLFVPNRIAVAISLAFLIAFAACREFYRYGRPWEKHKELSIKYGDAYSEKLEVYLDQSGLAGFVQSGWVLIEVELERGRQTA